MSDLTEVEIIEAQYRLFIEHVVQTGQVWGLHCTEGWANADSCDFPETLVYPFWSHEEVAKRCAVNEWSIFSPKALSLEEFLENWCVGMYKEYILAGVNWDEHLSGKETESLDLALQIIQEIKKRGQRMNLTLYKSLQEFEQMLVEVLSDERH